MNEVVREFLLEMILPILPDSVRIALLQLAQLYLYRNLLDTCMEACVTNINTIKTETGPVDKVDLEGD